MKKILSFLLALSMSYYVMPTTIDAQNRNGLGKFVEDVKNSSGNQNRNQRNDGQSNLSQMYQDAKRRAEGEKAEKKKASRADQTRKSDNSHNKEDKNKKKSVAADSQGDVNAKREQDDIALVVNGEGPNKTEATKNALRSAIEQAYGTFVSANTSIVNDELVRDEIATVASGNIKSYREISTTQLPNGNTSVSLSAVVSIGKLVQYAQAHGSSAEFAGQTFMMNMKMRELNKMNEAKALDHLLTMLESVSNTFYDYSIEIGEPSETKYTIGNGKKDPENKSGYEISKEGLTVINGYKLPVQLRISLNDNYWHWADEFRKTLETIALSEEEQSDYRKSNTPCFSLRVFEYGNVLKFRNDTKEFEKAVNRALQEGIRAEIKENHQNHKTITYFFSATNLRGDVYYYYIPSNAGYLVSRISTYAYQINPWWNQGNGYGIIINDSIVFFSEAGSSGWIYYFPLLLEKDELFSLSGLEVQPVQ